MKKILLLFLLSFCAFLLFSCQSQEEEMTLIDHVSSISIAKSEAYGGLNENYFTTINQTTHISSFEEIVENAEGRKQKVDIDTEKPDYDLLVRYQNGDTHGLHLVLGNTGEKSRIMYIGHEQNGFDISPEATNVLRNLVESQ